MRNIDLEMKLMMSLLLATALGASGCAAGAPEDLDEGGEEIGTAEQATILSQCLNFQRDVAGTVADATLWESAPSYNTGGYSLLYTGSSSAGFKQTLLRFDLGGIPAGAHVDSATISVYKGWKEKGSTVSVHEVLAPWSEASVTWASFNGAFDPAASTSFLAWGGSGSQVAFHVEALVQKWVDGVSDNHGFLFQEPSSSNSIFHSSEHGTISSHPKLRVCYTLDS